MMAEFFSKEWKLLNHLRAQNKAKRSFHCMIIHLEDQKMKLGNFKVEENCQNSRKMKLVRD